MSTPSEWQDTEKSLLDKTAEDWFYPSDIIWQQTFRHVEIPQGFGRIGNVRKPSNLRDNIFAVTQMPEIVGLLCSYKTNNLHIFRTETF